MAGLRERALCWIDEDRELLIGFFRDFVRCQSPNPPGDTREAIDFVAAYLDREALPYRRHAAEEHLPNLVGSITFPQPGRHLVLNGHADVFPIGRADLWEHDPWSGTIADGRLHGRGSADMKAGTTAAIFAYRYLARLHDELTGKVTLMIVSDEETGGRWGSQYLLEKLGDEVTGDCLLSGEPGGVGTIRFGEKGILQFSIDIRTRGAHGPYAHLSPSAIRIAGELMRELDALKAFKAKLPDAVAERITGERASAIINETMGPGTTEVMAAVTVNVGTIRGGSKINMVASDCVMEVDIRVPIGVDRDAVLAELDRIVARHPGATVGELRQGSVPNYSDPTHEMAELIAANVQSLGWPEPIRIPMLAASDCRMWRERAVPAFVYGPSPKNVSAPNESVLIEEFLHAVRVHTLCAIDYLSKDRSWSEVRTREA
ncbi:M20/M25/M40 family metallo-hydrolase [Enterovirga sp. CN4-39]|uniref:M20/M25/M40 family metallo-hydrolase n=1 Tax=Enterovirga sp. CN4-39 TaxID=3400910 RepID=UPI003C06F0ED